MNDLNNEYLKEDHFEDEEEDLNLEPQRYNDQDFDSPEEQLELTIMEEITKLEKKQDSISGDLENKLNALLGRITNQNQEEILRLRMNELALNKILVYTHGKSEFRLVAAHHHIGRAYLNYKCYEQAIDHLTLALKKNSKINNISNSKLYHSMVLTTLSRCYYEIASYEDALEVLTRAEDIQIACNNDSNQQKNNTETLKLIANCHCKLKNFKKAEEYIQKAMDYSLKIHGHRSKEAAKLNVEKAKIFNEQKNYENAISCLTEAINTLIEIKYKNKLQIAQLYETLSSYYEKSKQIQKQIQALYAKIQLYSQIYDWSHKNTLKLKRSAALILIKYEKKKEAIAELEQILEIQEKVYGTNSIPVGKTLKMLGITHLSNDQDSSSAQHYLKRAHKILQDQGNPKIVKEIKGKLAQIKQNRQKKINIMNTQS